MVLKKLYFQVQQVFMVVKKMPITEKASINPLNIYSKTKFFSEELIKDYNRIHGINFFILRYFNAAGSDFESEIGEFHEPKHI